MEYLKYLNKGIESIKPYEPGRNIDDVLNEFGLSKIVKLASNENNFGPSPKVLDILSNFNDFHLYPDGDGIELKKVIEKNEGYDFNQIILGNGSNEILELIAKAFLSSSTESIFSQHAFVVYKLASLVNGSNFHEVPAVDYGHSLNNFHNYINEKTRLIFIANPNNPTGTYNSHSEIIDFLNKVPNHVLVVIDLAYYEYVLADDYIDHKEILKSYSNVIFTRSFSKIHGIPALRIGYGVANHKLIEVLNRIRQPFNVNTIAQKAAIASLEDKSHLENSINKNYKNKLELYSLLDSIGLEYIKSEGNFIAIKTNLDNRVLFQNLMKDGVIIRPIDLYEMPEFIRVTIGTSEENKFFLEALKKYI